MKPSSNMKSQKRLIIKILLIVIILALPIGQIIAQYNESYDLIYNAPNNWNKLEYFENVFIHSSGIEEGSITLAENRNGPNEKTELMLSFDFDNKGKWVDKTKLGKYELLKNEFLISYENKRHGSSAGRFFRLKDGVSLVPGKNTLFKEIESAGSFTIDFWIYFYNTYNNQVIFEKKGQIINSLNEPITSGISSRLYNNKIEVSFENIFYLLESLLTEFPYSEKEIKLISKDTLVPEKWYHIAVSFDEYSGFLGLYINGVLQKGIWCTDDSSSRGEIFVPRFTEKENSPLFIATGLNGLLDDFHIQRKSVTDFEISKYIKSEGIIKSDIIDLDYDGSSIKNVFIESTKENNSDVIFEYRISSKYFLPESTPEILKWIDSRITSEIPVKYLYGRYLQWRIRLLPGYMYEYSPLVKSINIDVNYNLPPSKVLGVKGESRNGLVTLSWDGNIEKDIKAYKIYYGKESNNYLSEGSVITISKSQLIDPIKPSYTIRNLEKDVVYYISISAIDNYNIEGEFSDEISIRVKY